MRSVKKLLKKAMVFTLSVAMLVGTPLTASAAPLNSVYSIGDHWGEITKPGEGNDHSHTGTITNTATSTDSGVLKENETKILGIALDKKHLDVEVGGTQETLTATFLLDATEDELEKKYGHGTRTLKEELARRIRWEVQNPDGKVDAETNKTLSIRVTDADKDDNNKTGDASQVILNPRRGTKAGQDMIVKAYLEGSWYIGVKCDDKGNPILENGKEVPQIKELTDKKTDGYSAEATVSIKEYTKGLSWKDGESVTNTFVKHTVDLGELLVRDPATANDTITWTSTNTAVATVNAQGVVTVKVAASKVPTECKIIAMGEKQSARAERIIKVEEGTPVTKIEIYKQNDSTKEAIKKPIPWDLKEYKSAGYQASQGLAVQTYATVKNVIVSKTDAKKPALTADDAKTKTNGEFVTGNLVLPDKTDYYTIGTDKKVFPATDAKKAVTITDTITWSTNKAAIADVNPTTGETTAVTSKGTLGNAVITAKASSGKSAKVTFQVKGTLDTLAISGINPGETLYSGQTRDLVAVKNPVGSKDGVTWSISKVTKSGKETNHPNVTINGKGKLTIKDKLDPNYMTAEINLVSSKKDSATKKPLVTAQSVTINLAQSSINGITVTDVTNNNTVVAKTIYRNQTDTKKEDGEIKNQTANIKVPLNHSFQAVVNAGYNSTTQGLDAEALASTLTWTTNNNKVVDIVNLGGGNTKITAKAAGTATITVTGLRATSQVKNGATVLKGVSKLKVTFKVAVTQPVETITMSKSDVTLAYATQKKKINGVNTDVPKAQNVALKVTLGPKGVANNKETITWKVDQIAGTPKTADADKANIKPMKVQGKDVPNTKLNATVVLPKPEAGDVYVVTAKSTTGVVATSTIKIVQKTTGVEISESNTLVDDAPDPVHYRPAGKTKDVMNKKEINIGDDLQLYSFVNVGANAKDKKDWKLADGSDGTIEGVTYSVNKKGIVSIDNQGHVVGLGKGTVKITAKTPMGKSKAITVVVNVPK